MPSGGVSLETSSSAATIAAAVRNVKWFTYQDLKERPPTLQAWDAAWASCTDPQRPAMYVIGAPATSPAPPWNLSGSATACISFTRNYQRMRVVLPKLKVTTFFAGVVGVDAFKTTAAAEIEVGFDYPGGVLPYGIPESSSAATELCLGTGNALPGYLGFCEGGQAGNYGALDPSFYGSTGLNTLDQPYCSNTSAHGNNSATRIAMATAIGIDHPLGTVPNDATGLEAGESQWVNDRDVCTDAYPNSPPFLARPNDIATETGASAVATGVREGLIDGVDAALGLPAQVGRLTRSANTVIVNTASPALDNTPLWAFLTPGLTVGSSLATQVPAACNPSQSWDVEAMKACLDAYKSGGYSTVLFGADTDGNDGNGIYNIMRDPRFGFVPELWSDFPSGQSSSVQVRSFQTIFIQTLYWGCNGRRCAATFNPGQPLVDDQGSTIGPVGHTDRLDAVTALALPPASLPVEARNVSPGGNNEVGLGLVR